MFQKGFLLLAFATNIILGSVCMMPMAMAAEPLHNDANVMGQMVTPIAPMSHADCTHCSHRSEKKEQKPSSCTGHCLSQATNANSTNVVAGSTQLIATLPTAFPLPWSGNESAVTPLTINTSPPLNPSHSVVLRL